MTARPDPLWTRLLAAARAVRPRPAAPAPGRKPPAKPETDGAWVTLWIRDDAGWTPVGPFTLRFALKLRDRIADNRPDALVELFVAPVLPPGEPPCRI